MVRSRYEQSRKSEEKKNPSFTGADGGVSAGSRKNRGKQSLSARRNSTGPALPLERKASQGRYCRLKANEDRTQTKSRSRNRYPSEGDRTSQRGPSRDEYRASIDTKKKLLGLEGDLRNRHLSKDLREKLVELIRWATLEDETLGVTGACQILEINPRAYYRWIKGNLSSRAGGGGQNKITPLEEKRIKRMAEKNPEWHCRKIAYQLEKKSLAFVGKTKVAEIMKKHGLNHPFEQNIKPPQAIPGDMLLHEPWKKNLLWGMDWTWVNVGDKFMYLLVLVDWYSRKILSWSLNRQITRFEVVALVTNAAAIENIDKIGEDELRPIVVADHGSANTAGYTRENIEILGLDLWLCGIGRPTGNARTERTIGTLKNEEIKLQDRYDDEDEAYQRIKSKIYEFNFERPNAGNGGFAPNSVHVQGRYALTEKRKRARQTTESRRRIYWETQTAGV
jgi:putative transposase